MTKALELLNKSAQEFGVSSGEQFIKDGLDYRGQVQYAYTNNQKGGGFDIQIDPLKVNGLSSSFSVKGAVTVGKELFVVAAVGPNKAVKIGTQKNPSVTWMVDRPIMLASLQGGVWEGQASASFEVGVSYSAHAGISGATLLPETGNETLDTAASAELASIAFEASATFKADVGYTYSNAALEDMKPRYFAVNIAGADKAALKEEVTELFTAGSSKDAIKNAVVTLMNSYKEIYGEQSKTKWIGTNRDMADLTKTLLEGLAKAPSNDVGKTLRARVDNWLGKATPYKATTASQRGLCVLSISSHRPEASAGVSASIEAKASANKLGSGAISMNFKGPSISGVGKWSSSRFQTYWPIANTEYLMLTQDQKIRYGQVDVTAFSAQANVELNVAGGGGKEKPTLQRGGSLQENKVVPAAKQPAKPAEEPKPTFSAEASAEKKWVYSSLSYTSVCVYWMRSADDAKINDGALVEPLQGSGISIGRSTTLGTLQRLLKAFWDPSDKQLEGDAAGCKLYQFLAEALHVPVAVLSEMLWSPEVKGLITDLASQKDAVEKLIREAKPAMKPERAERLRKNFGGGELPLLIEATFRLPTVDLKLKKSKDGSAKLDEKLFDKAVAAFNKLPVADVPKYLESIRIRLRMRDLQETEDSTRLGFSLFGQSLGVSYKSIDKAGAEGTVDLATYWTASELKGGGAAAYEVGVPKAILLDQ